ncbi:hypothetical protein BY458DRAFT_502716 [Sporodiniella umbellata]|nr:hypothetical protein BY458DRAFT_502716 [Sporodiniella umbellata]
MILDFAFWQLGVFFFKKEPNQRLRAICCMTQMIVKCLIRSSKKKKKNNRNRVHFLKQHIAFTNSIVYHLLQISAFLRPILDSSNSCCMLLGTTIIIVTIVFIGK